MIYDVAELFWAKGFLLSRRRKDGRREEDVR